MRYLVTLVAVFIVLVNVYSQDLKPFTIQFDKPLYTAGETAWFAVFLTDSIVNEGRNEVLHFEMISPANIKVLQGKINLRGRLAQGYLQLPNDLDEGYYRFRLFTLQQLKEGGQYIYADIPVYSEWTENITVFKFEDELIEETVTNPDVEVDKKKKSYSRRDTVEYSDLIANTNEGWYYAFWVQPREFKDFTPIEPAMKDIVKKFEVISELEREDSLYFEAFLSDNESGVGVTSPMISIYSGENQRFFRSKSKDGWLSLKLPNYHGDFTLQVFNLNPYQEAVNQLRVKQWSINEGYFNPAKPPVTKEIADYLIKAKRRRKINDMFSLISAQEAVISVDTNRITPDLQYKMSDYRFINNLEEFIFEAIPGARFVELEDGKSSVRLYNPERRSVFVDRPWYIVDGYLTSREEEVLKIPFSDIDEILLYVDTKTIKDHFEYFLWRNGILEVRTKDIKYLRSLKKDPNYIDFSGFQPEMSFVKYLQQLVHSDAPDFRTTMFWETGSWEDDDQKIKFVLSDDTGEFIYHFMGISSSGEMIRKEGEFEIR